MAAPIGTGIDGAAISLRLTRRRTSLPFLRSPFSLNSIFSIFDFLGFDFVLWIFHEFFFLLILSEIYDAILVFLRNFVFVIFVIFVFF